MKICSRYVAPNNLSDLISKMESLWSYRPYDIFHSGRCWFRAVSRRINLPIYTAAPRERDIIIPWKLQGVIMYLAVRSRDHVINKTPDDKLFQWTGKVSGRPSVRAHNRQRTPASGRQRQAASRHSTRNPIFRLF